MSESVILRASVAAEARMAKLQAVQNVKDDGSQTGDPTNTLYQMQKHVHSLGGTLM